jgi:hypothetical protein
MSMNGRPSIQPERLLEVSLLMRHSRGELRAVAIRRCRKDHLVIRDKSELTNLMLLLIVAKPALARYFKRSRFSAVEALYNQGVQLRVSPEPQRAVG